MAGRTRARRRFALVGVVVTIGLGAALVAVAPANADTVTSTSAANTVTAVAAATQALAASRGASALERDHVQAALASVQAVADAGGTAWSDLSGTTAPASSAQFSVGFDDGQLVPSGLPDSFGDRAAIVTVGDDGSGYVGAVFGLTGAATVCTLTGALDTAQLLLAAVGTDATCPSSEPAPTTSAITSTWAWGNSVDPSADNRGLGEPGMAPDAIAAFALAHGLSRVYLSVPWAANEGAIAPWLSDTVDALHADGITVSALGGDASWLAQPGLVSQWVTDARAAADFDAVELDIEPWAGVTDPDYATITPQFVSLLTEARAAAGPLPLGIDLPWWLTTTWNGPSTVFDTLLAQVDSVAIVAFSDHAAGDGGIVALASPAVAAAAAAGKSFTIGVETDTPEVAGGAENTFFDEGAPALESAASEVRTAFGSTPGYQGVSVEQLLSWVSLIGASS